MKASTAASNMLIPLGFIAERHNRVAVHALAEDAETNGASVTGALNIVIVPVDRAVRRKIDISRRDDGVPDSIVPVRDVMAPEESEELA